MSNHTLVVCFTRSGNTLKLAQTISAKLNADLLELKPVNSYPANYRDCVEQSKEELAVNYCPPLQPYQVDLTQYDTVVIGSPIWCGTYAPPIHTFLRDHDLSGKTVLPFCTHGGGGQSSFTMDIKAACPGSNVLSTLVLYDDGFPNADAKITQWLTGNSMM